VGARARRGGAGLRGHDQAARAVHDAAGVPGGHGAVLAENGRQGRELLERGVGLEVVVRLDEHGRSLSRDGHGGDFGLEEPFAGGARALPVAAEGVFVLRGARDAVLARQGVGRLRHEEAAEGVPERLVEGVYQRQVAAEADGFPAQAAHEMGGLAHVLHAAGQDPGGVPGTDEPGGLGDGLEAGPAEPVHGDGARLDPEARLEGHVPGAVDGVRPGLEGVADHAVVEKRGGDAALFDRGARGVGGQVHRGHAAEGAVPGGARVLRPRGARPFDDDDGVFGHVSCP
jgi:hypothetical protein